jgi:hypothetical protein
MWRTHLDRGQRVKAASKHEDQPSDERGVKGAYCDDACLNKPLDHGNSSTILERTVLGYQLSMRTVPADPEI